MTCKLRDVGNYVLMINKTIKFSSFSVIFLVLFYKRNRKYYRVIETLVKVWENSKKLWKQLPAARVFTAFLVLFLNRPIRLIQCCTQFRTLGVKVLCVFHLHDDIAFTFK